MIGINGRGGVCEGECVGCSTGDEPLTDEMPHFGFQKLNEDLEGWKSAHNLKNIKRNVKKGSEPHRAKSGDTPPT